MPSYWAAILIYWLACYALPALQDDYAAFMVRLPSYLAFLPEYADTDGFSIFTHSWTVGVELKFYLLFPPAVFLMTRNTNCRFAAIAIAAALFTAHYVRTGDAKTALERTTSSVFDLLETTYRSGERELQLIEAQEFYAVPRMQFIEHRPMLVEWCEKRGSEGIQKYWEEKNHTSIDGLPTGLLE